MSKNVPLSFFYGWGRIPDELAPVFMAEFQANGAENLTLGDDQSERMLKEPRCFSKLLRLSRYFNLKFNDAHAPFGECYDLNTCIEERRPGMISDQIRAMSYAAELGCKTFVIHLGAWDCCCRPEITFESMRERSVKALEQLIPAAEKLHIILAIENSFERSNSPDEVLYLLKQFESPYFGCCFDTGHANFMAPLPDGTPKKYDEYHIKYAWRGEVTQEAHALDKLLPYIVTSHLHDNSGLGDDHNLPGTGTIDWKSLMPKLKSAPRLTTLQSEVSAIRYNIPIRKLCETMREIVAL